VSEKTDMEAFERMVERVLAYRPKKKRKKAKRKAGRAKKKGKDRFASKSLP
jgi:hypothetical protein